MLAPLILNFLFLKDAGFILCVCLDIMLTGKCRNPLRNSRTCAIVGFGAGAIEQLNFLVCFGVVTQAHLCCTEFVCHVNQFHKHLTN